LLLKAKIAFYFDSSNLYLMCWCCCDCDRAFVAKFVFSDANFPQSCPIFGREKFAALTVTVGDCMPCSEICDCTRENAWLPSLCMFRYFECCICICMLCYIYCHVAQCIWAQGVLL